MAEDLDPQTATQGLRSDEGGLSLRAPRALLPVAWCVSHTGDPALPLLGHRHVRRGPCGQIAAEDERVVVNDPEIGGGDLPTRLPHLQAEVEVVAVQLLAEGLVEANVADHPR